MVATGKFRFCINYYSLAHPKSMCVTNIHIIKINFLSSEELLSLELSGELHRFCCAKAKNDNISYNAI